jgi:membrane protein implicated in regulation of membrane protease activity
MTFWHWLVAGGLLVTAEAFAPGFFLAWLGVAAGLTGAVAWLAPGLSWQWQVLAFALLSFASVAAWFGIRGRFSTLPADPGLNRRAARYVGQLFEVVEPIENGRGRIRVGDSEWTALGPDLPAGARVRVVGSEGTALRVVAAPDATLDPARGGG